jgi:hypothetical protein
MEETQFFPTPHVVRANNRTLLLPRRTRVREGSANAPTSLCFLKPTQRVNTLPNTARLRIFEVPQTLLQTRFRKSYRVSNFRSF